MAGTACHLGRGGGPPLEPLRMHDRDREHHERHGLMQQRERERRLVQQGGDAEHGLQGDGRGQRER